MYTMVYVWVCYDSSKLYVLCHYFLQTIYRSILTVQDKIISEIVHGFVYMIVKTVKIVFNEIVMKSHTYIGS